MKILPLILATLVGCGGAGGPSAHAPPVVAASLPARVLTLDQASVELWQPDLRPGWRDPSSAETLAISHLIPALLQAARDGVVPDAVVAEAASVSLVVSRWIIDGSEQLVLSEPPEARRGAGAYLFAVGRVSPAKAPWILLEAPHAYHDQGTGRLAAALYLNPPPGPAPLALFTNSLHRYTLPDGSRKKSSKSASDAARNPAHLLAVATKAAALSRPGATVVQLHGFVAADEENDPPSDTLVVVSAGLEDGPTALSSDAAARLEALFGADAVRLFPTEVTVLGATTNAELLLLRDVPGARFLHIELSPSLRAGLPGQPDRLSAFGAAIFAAAYNP